MMEMSAKLGRLIFYIEIWHFLALCIIVTVNTWFYRNSNRGPLLYRFLALQGALMIWVISKMLKTLSPHLTLRWIFVVSQYFGVCFLGVLFFLFAWCFVFENDFPWPGRIFLYSTAMLCFISVLTNPLHHLFYARFNFYRDSFGPLFYAFSIFTYLLIISGILLFFLGVKRSARDGRSSGNVFIVLAAVFPFFINAAYTYRIIRPLFDYTPLFMTFSLSFFGIAAFRSQFLGIIPAAQKRILLDLEDPFILTDRNGDTVQITKLQPYTSPKTEIIQYGHCYRLYRKTTGQKGTLYHYIDETKNNSLRNMLEQKNLDLRTSLSEMESRNQQTLELMRTQTANRYRRFLHDILGHSLTRIIFMLRLALNQNTPLEKGTNLQRDLLEALSDGRLLLQSKLTGEIHEGNSLSIALQRLLDSISFPQIRIDFLFRGSEIPLPEELVQELLLCCREGITNAVKHGRANNIILMLLYGSTSVALLINDDGSGCSSPEEGNGLEMMRRSIEGFKGTVKVISEEGGGFQLTIKLSIPSTPEEHGKSAVPKEKHHFREEGASQLG